MINIDDASPVRRTCARAEHSIMSLDLAKNGATMKPIRALHVSILTVGCALALVSACSSGTAEPTAGTGAGTTTTTTSTTTTTTSGSTTASSSSGGPAH